MEKTLKKIRQFFLPLAFVFIAASFSGAYYSDNVSVTNNNFTAGTWSVTPTVTATASATATSTPPSIVINEAMVDPSSTLDAGINPEGEWVEIYNLSDVTVDVNGWQIRDSGSNYYTINSTKTNTGSTLIISGGRLAIYRNMGSSMFNNDGDTVKLFNGSTLIDLFSYTTTIDGKSWARVDEGTGAFTDGHIPTPGGPNA